jgi:hypothetical protein
MDETYDLNNPLATVLAAVLPWVDQENRELMIKEIGDKLGDDAWLLLKDIYAIHRINRTGD